MFGPSRRSFSGPLGGVRYSDSYVGGGGDTLLFGEGLVREALKIDILISL